MSQFQFTGEWEFQLPLPGFAGFQQSDGALSVTIDDLLNEDPDPLAQQLAALDYLIENSVLIAQRICTHVFNEYPALIKVYGDLPVVHHVDDIKKFIRVNHVSISTRFKDGISFMDFSAHCDWDEDHGLGIGMHRLAVIHMGGIGDGYEVEEDAELKDVNTYVKKKPQLYLPHPKYNRLKPSQESENRYYELELIRGFHNEDFMHLISSGQRDVNYINPKWGFFGSYIAWAIQYNNQELVSFLMERHARLDYILHEVGRDKQKIEWLLAHGVSINERNRSGHVLLREQLFHLRGVLMNQEQYKVTHPGVHDDTYYSNALKEDIEYIRWLVGKGATLPQEDINSVLNFSGRDYDNERIKRVLIKSVEPIPSKTITPNPTPTRPWWKFWE